MSSVHGAAFEKRLDLPRERLVIDALQIEDEVSERGVVGGVLLGCKVDLDLRERPRGQVRQHDGLDVADEQAALGETVSYLPRGDRGRSRPDRPAQPQVAEVPGEVNNLDVDDIDPEDYDDEGRPRFTSG